jgi:hypothetical protein
MTDREASAAPFFVIGSGRSGSTLLRLILASHSRLSIPPETWYLEDLLAHLPVDRALSRTEVERAARIMTEHYRWPDMKFGADEFRQAALALQNPTLRDVVDLVYNSFLKREHKSRWGDKTPGYIKIVDRLIALYPQAKFIHIVRDGRDVAKSFQSVGWYGPWLYKNTQEWTEAVGLAKRWGSSAFSSRIYLVRYEDLVLDTETTVRGICAFLDEEYESQMLSWQRNVGELVPEREKQIHGKLDRASEQSDVARWQREMTRREVFVAEAFMSGDLQRLGYPLRYGAAWMPLQAVTRFCCNTVLPAVSFLQRAARFFAKRIVFWKPPGEASRKLRNSTQHHA